MDNTKGRSMLRLKNDTHIIFFEVSQMQEAIAFRKSNPAFKNRRITNVLQLIPSDVTVGEVMDRTN